MNTRLLVVGILAILLFSAFAAGVAGAGVHGNSKEEKSAGDFGKIVEINGVKYITHDVIRINNDTDFANQAAAEGWPGDGTQSNPYIISGYDIDAHGAGNAIYIGNTTVYFVVENCYLHNTSLQSWPYFAGTGITLYKVTNGTLENNTCSNNDWDGIYLWYSSNNVISNNTCSNNGDGIYLDYSSNNMISNNTCSNNDQGIWLYSSSNNVISNNTCSNNGYGIYLYYYSSNNVITNNTYSNNNWDGIFLDSSSNGNVISNNLFANNTDYGIYIYSGSNNHIYHNSFYYNQGSGGTYNSSHVQAYDDGSNNYWNSTTGIGNYWYEWANNNNTNDQNHDGIVDWPYKIAGSAGAKDYYPLKNKSLSNVLSHPMNLTAIAGNGYVNLTWEPPVYGKDTVTQYNIYRDGVLIKIKTVSGNQLYYNDTSVTNGQTYTYYVTAVNSAGESDKSNEVQATPGGAVPEMQVFWLPIIALIILAGILRRQRKRV